VGDAVPAEDEVLRLLGEAARAGNVSAMKELRVYHREHSATEQNPLVEPDELAELRGRRGRHMTPLSPP
jgi:hypothetical protein